MSAAVEVRPARPDELGAVGSLTVAAYEEFMTGRDDPYRARLGDAASRDAEAELWVAVDDDELLGTVTVCRAGSAWREIAQDDEGEFRMLAVAPGARGRGVGRTLAIAAVEAFRGDGAARVVLSSLEAMTAAHRLYESLGFARLPDRDWHPLPEVSLIAYSLELTP